MCETHSRAYGGARPHPLNPGPSRLGETARAYPSTLVPVSISPYPLLFASSVRPVSSLLSVLFPSSSPGALDI